VYMFECVWACVWVCVLINTLRMSVYLLLSQCGHHVPFLVSAGKHATTLGHLLQCGMQYDIVLGMFALTDKVLEHRSVVSQNTVLVSSGDHVELVISQCNVSPLFT
jgi:hypothetical protein